MSKKFDKKPLAIAIGTAVAGSLSATAGADTNPFGMSELSSGYMQVAQAEMKCGEGKCGGKMKQQMQKQGAEGKCAGAKPEKKAEGKCGEMMKKQGAEGKCGGSKSEEAKCGAMMKEKAAQQPAATEEKK